MKGNKAPNRRKAHKPKPESQMVFGKGKHLSPRERKAMADLRRFEAQVIDEVHEDMQVTEEVRRARAHLEDERRELS